MKCQLHITQAAFTVESISWGVGALYNILARDKQFTSSIILTAFMTGQQATIPSARAVVSRSRWKMQGVFPHNPLLQFVWSLWDCNSFWELPPQTGCAERGTPPSILLSGIKSSIQHSLSQDSCLPLTPSSTYTPALGYMGSAVPAWRWAKNIPAALHCSGEWVSPSSSVRSGPFGSTE